LGVVLESHLDPQKGPVATILVKTGVLKEGQDIVAGTTYGRVRRIENFKGQRVTEAGPSSPISLIGLNSAPNSNDILQVATDKANARNRALIGKFNQTGNQEAQNTRTVMKTIVDEKVKRLNIILKSDVQGSLEAILQILGEIKSDEVAIDYIEMGVSNITESDVRLAGNTHAIVYGFNVEATTVAKRMAENAKVEIKNFRVIYELVDDIKSKLVAMLPPIVERTDFGKMQVLAIFKTGRGDMIVGGKILTGKMVNGTLLEVMRGENVIGKGTLKNLQENKVDVDEVTKQKECGVTFLGETKIKVDDTLLCYREEIKKRTL